MNLESIIKKAVKEAFEEDNETINVYSDCWIWYMDDGGDYTENCKYGGYPGHEIQDAFKEYMGDDDLANYIDERYPLLQEKVESIIMDFDPQRMQTKAICKVSSDFLSNPEAIQELKDYLEGQYADGWGEGFEQKTFDTIVEQEIEYEFDEETGEEEGYEYDVETLVTIKTWDHKEDLNWEIVKA